MLIISGQYNSKSERSRKYTANRIGPSIAEALPADCLYLAHSSHLTVSLASARHGHSISNRPIERPHGVPQIQKIGQPCPASVWVAKLGAYVEVGELYTPQHRGTSSLSAAMSPGLLGYHQAQATGSR